MERFPQNRPLWELHIIKYPNTNAAGNVVFKLHQSLGDGYSLMGALLSCLQRADNPSLSLTFPSRKRSKLQSDKEKSLFSFVPQIFSSAFNTLSDFGRSILKSNLFEDDQTPIRSGDDRVEFLPITITTVAFSLDKLKLIKSKLGVSESTALVVLNTRMRGGDYKSVKEMLNPETKMPWGNRFSFLHVEIPTLSEFTNPIDFVAHAHRIIKKKRSSYAVYLNGLLLEVLKILGGHEVAARYVTKTLRSSSMTISNMIGPVEEMSLANHPITGFYFVGAGLPEDLGITIVSYMGKLRVAFRMAKGHIDSHKLKSCVENAFETIFEASNKLPSY
ncbi:hypothetical protein FEM48_Zijuj04G0122900 [Ziziphus jujuba var. spinosa]|uniref:O-acyltransferase WSD1 C-terminal domain-containing protein n=1 Tax=Ziziphus jujuba var. spinosa TaxID=714518 RepID=A0A978VJU4_ZIZJJ|nr:hypothetical protein FEM48_Zijuj04G0122900 [Ziziphus jujuba var. spinosa]